MSNVSALTVDECLDAMEFALDDVDLRKPGNCAPLIPLLERDGRILRDSKGRPFWANSDAIHEVDAP